MGRISEKQYTAPADEEKIQGISDEEFEAKRKIKEVFFSVA